MRITVEKTGALATSIAYRAKAIMDDIDILAVMGSTEDEARAQLIEGLADVQFEITALLAVETLEDAKRNPENYNSFLGADLKFHPVKKPANKIQS